MSKIWGKIRGLFTNRSFEGTDKSGNHYFARTELIDGIMKEKRWVVFKGEHEPTSVPVEWICWLNGQRKRAPTPEEMADMEARRERVRHNVALLKKEEEERRAKAGRNNKRTTTGKVEGPDLKSFVQQFPAASEDGKSKDTPAATSGTRSLQEKTAYQEEQEHESTEPSGSGSSFKPGTWQPPT
ncbi:NADH dehydrogenase [ubiquinone] 1 alpha subcomplex subunit 12 [Heracleum sosnowskyi]|uniref:NADH dehydrogenase [ubiquinone] 1 alpha subcomplex subunit 12 n=1 Tax=Heracleum sosnowskyi TaxID=360622 RepID=A0AAD8M697_9APIA|nr:NADH dehydrogenase [ubiquinone] 1 alpha subcomplex subunit 12 [Heracleum sosnowskyi]